MQPDVLVALYNMSKASNKLSDVNKYKNRIVQVGSALEIYVKNSFCGVPNKLDGNIEDLLNRVFSYKGNQNNPPDAIIKEGDAIEIKKLEGISASSIALNSSYPKSKIYSDSTLITKGARNCEPGWKVKGIAYVIGSVIGEQLSAIDFVYGDCYAADKEVYERILSKVKSTLNSEDVEFSKTKEVGRVNRVDPLGITYFRLRGMWGIKTPAKVFREKIGKSRKGSFTITAIMKESKYLSFPAEHRKLIEGSDFKIEDIKISDPNNPAKLLKAKFLVYNRV
jgi:hypothetical protein